MLRPRVRTRSIGSSEDRTERERSAREEEGGGGESFRSYVNRVVISLKSGEKSGESWRPGEESSRGQKGFREDVDDGGAMQQRRQHRQQEGEHRLHRRQQQQLQLVPVHDGRETR